LLTVTPPAANTDGSPAATLGRVEVYRLEADSRSDTGPAPEEDILTRGVKVFSVPAADFTRYLKDGALAFWDLSAAVNPAAFYARSFRYAVLFYNRKNQTAGLSNQAFLAPVPIPAAPAGLSCTYFPDRIRLSWKPPDRNEDGSMPPPPDGYAPPPPPGYGPPPAPPPAPPFQRGPAPGNDRSLTSGTGGLY